MFPISWISESWKYKDEAPSDVIRVDSDSESSGPPYIRVLGSFTIRVPRATAPVAPLVDPPVHIGNESQVEETQQD